MKLLWWVPSLLLLAPSLQTTCYDTKCCRDPPSPHLTLVHDKYCIPCDQSENHCVLERGDRLVCVPGSTAMGVQCHTDNSYFHRYCAADSYGNGYCDGSGAILFWALITIMTLLFTCTQMSLLCCCCRAARRRGSEPRIQITNLVTNYGATGPVGGVLPEVQQPLLTPLQPAAPRLEPPAAPHTDQPPSYEHVVENLQPTFQNPPTNPFYQFQ